MFQGCLTWSFLVHNLRLRIDSFFVRLFCIVFDILGISGCTFGTIVALWGALGAPTRAPQWGIPGFLGLSRDVLILGFFFLRFSVFREQF
jgi:hypothetical protein